MVIFYHNEGDKGIATHAFDQLSKDSDRAAAIVAGSIIEQRLAELLQSRFPSGKLAENLTEQLFHSSGPLGSFSAKINVAYLFGYISVEAQADLQVMKDIRNRFAHRIDLDKFGDRAIASRCENLRLVDEYVGDVMPRKSEGGRQILMAYDGASEDLRNPRNRYITTAMVFNFFLGAKPGSGWSRPASGPVI